MRPGPPLTVHAWGWPNEHGDIRVFSTNARDLPEATWPDGVRQLIGDRHAQRDGRTKGRVLVAYFFDWVRQADEPFAVLTYHAATAYIEVGLLACTVGFYGHLRQDAEVRLLACAEEIARRINAPYLAWAVKNPKAVTVIEAQYRFTRASAQESARRQIPRGATLLVRELAP